MGNSLSLTRLLHATLWSSPNSKSSGRHGPNHSLLHSNKAIADRNWFFLYNIYPCRSNCFIWRSELPTDCLTDTLTKAMWLQVHNENRGKKWKSWGDIFWNKVFFLILLSCMECRMRTKSLNCGNSLTIYRAPWKSMHCNWIIWSCIITWLWALWFLYNCVVKQDK